MLKIYKYKINLIFKYSSVQYFIVIAVSMFDPEITHNVISLNYSSGTWYIIYCRTGNEIFLKNIKCLLKYVRSSIIHHEFVQYMGFLIFMQ